MPGATFGVRREEKLTIAHTVSSARAGHVVYAFHTTHGVHTIHRVQLIQYIQHIHHKQCMYRMGKGEDVSAFSIIALLCDSPDRCICASRCTSIFVPPAYNIP